MGCCNCKYLVASDGKKGCVNGSIYYCNKMKMYVNGSNDSCDDYYKDYSRKLYQCDDIYNDGVSYCNENTPIEIYIVLFIFLAILSLIVN